MIWPFNSAERKARKLGRNKIMLAGYEAKLAVVRGHIKLCEKSVPGVLIRSEQDLAEIVGGMKEEIRQLESERV